MPYAQSTIEQLLASACFETWVFPADAFLNQGHGHERQPIPLAFAPNPMIHFQASLGFEVMGGAIENY